MCLAKKGIGLHLKFMGMSYQKIIIVILVITSIQNHFDACHCSRLQQNHKKYEILRYVLKLQALKNISAENMWTWDNDDTSNV